MRMAGSPAAGIALMYSSMTGHALVEAAMQHSCAITLLQAPLLALHTWPPTACRRASARLCTCSIHGLLLNERQICMCNTSGSGTAIK